jgi:ABC-type sulfate/molybdate transport systems ATPase subunit
MEVLNAIYEADFLGFSYQRLSTGERQRIALVRALASGRPPGPRVFLLDEPTAGIDGIAAAADREQHAGRSLRHRRTGRQPFLAHASIGTCCAVARWSGGTVEVWRHS